MKKIAVLFLVLFVAGSCIAATAFEQVMAAAGYNGSHDLAADGNYIYAAGFGSNSLYRVDITDPENPVFVYSLGGITYIHDIVVYGDYAYVTQMQTTNAVSSVYLEPEAGVEKMVNGSFTGSADGWTLGDAGWSYNNNAVDYNSANGSGVLTSSAPVEIGKHYTLTYTTSGITANRGTGVTASCGGNTFAKRTNNAPWTENFTATTTAPLVFTPVTGLTDGNDYISVVRGTGANKRADNVRNAINANADCNSRIYAQTNGTGLGNCVNFSATAFSGGTPSTYATLTTIEADVNGRITLTSKTIGDYGNHYVYNLLLLITNSLIFIPRNSPRCLTIDTVSLKPQMYVADQLRDNTLLSNVHAIAISEDGKWIYAGAKGLYSFSVIDANDPTNLHFEGTYTASPYTDLYHPRGMVVRGNLVYTICEGWGKLAIVNVANKAAPVKYGTPTSVIADPCGTDDAGNLVMKDYTIGGQNKIFAFVTTSRWQNKVVVVDVTDPNNMIVEPNYITMPTPNYIKISGYYLFVSSIYNTGAAPYDKLYVIDVHDPLKPYVVYSGGDWGAYSGGVYLSGIAIKDGYVFVAMRDYYNKAMAIWKSDEAETPYVRKFSFVGNTIGEGPVK